MILYKHYSNRYLKLTHIRRACRRAYKPFPDFIFSAFPLLKMKLRSETFDSSDDIIISTIKNYINQNVLASTQVEQKKIIVELVEYLTTQPKFLKNHPRLREACIKKMNELCADPLALSIRPILQEFREYVNGLEQI